MSRPRDFQPDQVITAIKGAKGMVYLAAEALGCSHQTVYNYIERYPEIKEAWEHATNRVTDVAETRLFDAIERDESWAIAFYLKTKGKGRGYIERQEHTGADGGPLSIAYVNDWRGNADD